MLVIEKPDQVLHDVEAESVRIMADNVVLVRPKIDGQWKTENEYGVYIGRDSLGRSFRRAEVIGGEICNIWRKAVVGQNMSIRATHIHDFGEDGIIVGPEGLVEIIGNTIERGGLDPQSDRSFYNRRGDFLHCDGIQGVAGSYWNIRQNVIRLVHGEVDADTGLQRSGNACIYMESDWGNVHDLRIVANELHGGVYTLRVRDEDNGYRCSNMRVARNVFHEHYSAASLFQTVEAPSVDFKKREGVDSNDYSNARRVRFD